MKAVLISIKPKWCELIASGEKPIEVRKSRPKLETPFKVYIYCTKSKKHFLQSKDNMFFYCEESDFIGKHGAGLYQRLNGKVIGEFVCDRIDEIIPDYNPITKKFMYGNVYNLESACLENEQCQEYGKGKPLYGWHISNLKIYDKPKELSEFYPIKPKRIEDWTDKDDCAYCKYHKWVGSMQEYVEKGKPMREKCTLGKPEPICEYTPPVSRPPQSWCYVEELQNG